MNFPSFADTDGFLGLGQTCYQALVGPASIFEGCYDSIRPLGIALFYAIPFAISLDPVTVSYLVLGMHIIIFLIMCFSVNSVFERERHFFLSPINPLWFLMISAIVLVFALPVIPVALSDLSSATSFMLAVAILFRSRVSGTAAFSAGLLFGFACLLRQYYFAFTALAVLSFVVCMREEFKSMSLRTIALFFLGCSFALLQFLWVWLHTGKLWVYDSSVASFDLYVNKAPYVEMIIYSIPINSAYVTSIGNEILDPFSFFCLKLLKGFYSLYPAVYLGHAPLQSEPQIISVDNMLLFKAYAGFLFLLLGTVGAMYRNLPHYRAVLLLALLMSVMFAVIGHVESRYFLLPKILYVTYIVITARFWLIRLSRVAI